jgi:hypothetical protein
VGTVQIIRTCLDYWSSTAVMARAVRKLSETVSRNVVDDIYRCSFKKQTGVSLKYMMDFGAYPSGRNLLLSSQFLHKELPVRLAHRVTELENLPHGLSTKAPVLKAKFSPLPHTAVHPSSFIYPSFLLCLLWLLLHVENVKNMMSILN